MHLYKAPIGFFVCGINIAVLNHEAHGMALSDAFINNLKEGYFTMGKRSFSATAIVACGTMGLEINHLRAEGFLVEALNNLNG